MAVVDEARNVLRQLGDIEYGFIDHKGVVHRQSDDDFDAIEFGNYRLQSPEQVEKNRVGVCWDQVEYERHLFANKGIKTDSYAIIYYDYEGDNYFNHTILTFQDEGSYYWFEHSMQCRAGVHRFDNMRELLAKLKEDFLAAESRIPSDYIEDRLKIFRYDSLKPNMTPLEIFKFWDNSEDVTEVAANK